MAKIPRINQGDRPSAAFSPTMDASVSAMMGSIGDVAGEALQTATSEELAERKRLSEALAAKQAIVNASNEGVVNTDFENSSYKTLQQLEADYADTPEEIPTKYREIMEEQQKSLVKRQDLNDAVKLGAVKNAESTISSGLRQSYAISSNLQTKKVKGNLASIRNQVTNGAAYQPSAAATQQYAEAQIAKMMPQMRLVHGKAADEEADKIRQDMAARYAAHAARNNPQQLSEELEKSPFLLAMPDTEHKAASAAADASYFKINDIRNLDIAKEAFAAGETLAASLGTDEFIDAAADRSKKLEAEREMAKLGRDANGQRLKPADAEVRMDTLDKQIARVEKLRAMNYKQLDSVGIDDADTMFKLTTRHNKVFADIGDTSEKENLDALLSYQDELEAARDAKKISKATYDTMKASINEAYRGVTSEQSGKYGWLSFLNSERAGGKEINDKFESSHAAFPPEVRSKVWVEYTRELQEAQRSGKVTPAAAKKIAQKALSLKTGLEVPGAYE